MTGALAWLNEAMVWLASWVPRLVVVLASEKGIRYRQGKDVFVLEPGPHIYWPILTRVQTVNVMRSVQNLSTQTLTTADGVAVIASGVMVYRVDDVERFLVENHDAEAGIDEVACASIRQVMLSMTLEEIHAASIGLGMNDRLRREARKSLGPFGIRVEYLRLTDCAPAQVFSLAGIPSTVELVTTKAEAA